MTFPRKIFLDYFDNKFDELTLANKLEMDAPEFASKLKTAIVQCEIDQDADMLEFLIYALMLWDDMYASLSDETVASFVGTLNKLLVSMWHMQHENIVDLLQEVADESSVPFLYDAVYMNLKYLAWDENLSFPKKCVRAIAAIGGEEAAEKLKRLSVSDNSAICALANRKLDEIIG